MAQRQSKEVAHPRLKISFKAGVLLLLFGSLIGLAWYYSYQTALVEDRATEYQQLAAKLVKSTHLKAKQTQVLVASQAQTVKTIETTLNKFVQTEQTLVDIAQDNSGGAQLKRQDALSVIDTLTDERATFSAADKGLICDPRRTDGLKVSVTKAPEYNAQTPAINVMFHFAYRGKDVYLTTASLNLSSFKLTNFTPYNTDQAQSYLSDYLKAQQVKAQQAITSHSKEGNEHD